MTLPFGYCRIWRCLYKNPNWINGPCVNILIFDLLTNINQKRLTLQMEQMQFEKFTMKFPEENVGPNEASQAVLKLNQTSHV